jgi:hypothetical protein
VIEELINNSKAYYLTTFPFNANKMNRQAFNRISFVFPILSYGVNSFIQFVFLRTINHTCNEIFNDETYLILWNNSLTIKELYELSTKAIFPYLYKIIRCVLFQNPFQNINRGMSNDYKIFHSFERLMKEGKYFYNNSGFEKLISEFDRLIEEAKKKQISKLRETHSQYKELNNQVLSLINGSTNFYNKTIKKIREFFNDMFQYERNEIFYTLRKEIECRGTTGFENIKSLFPEKYATIEINVLSRYLKEHKQLEEAIKNKTIDTLPAFNNFPQLLEKLIKEGYIGSSFPIAQTTRIQIIKGIYKSHCLCYQRTLSLVCDRLYELFEKLERNGYLKLKDFLFTAF